MLYKNRYDKFKFDNKMYNIPNLHIAQLPTDKIVVFKKGITRMDKLSQTYYGTPYMGFLIRLANKQYEGMEFDIPEGALIRIPFPLSTAVELYNKAVDSYIRLEGLE